MQYISWIICKKITAWIQQILRSSIARADVSMPMSSDYWCVYCCKQSAARATVQGVTTIYNVIYDGFALKFSGNVIYGGRYIWWFDFENFRKFWRPTNFFTSENFKNPFFVPQKISKTMYLTTIYNVIYGGSKTKIFENFGKRYIWWSLYMVVIPCRTLRVHVHAGV